MSDSRNVNILENILGADNVILPPFSRIEVLLIRIGELIGTATDFTPITSDDIDEIIATIE